MKTIFIFFIALLFTHSMVNAQDNDKFTIVLDAGHGGNDGGNSHGGTNEKDIALTVTKQVGKLLESDDRFKVIYTRKTDKFIGLKARADVANDNNADFFVSIHCNAADNKSAKGTETFVLGLHNNAANLEVMKRENSVIYLEENYEEIYDGLNPNDPASFATNVIMQEEYLDDSIEMAGNVQTNFEKELPTRNRGVKQLGLAVLRYSYMPSVLVEIGFLSNTTERNFLKSKAGQKKVARSVYDGIVSYHENRDINLFKVEDVKELNTITAVDPNVFYKVQIAASSNKLKAASYNFKKLPKITREEAGTIYRYFTGKEGTIKEAQKLRNKAVQLGYTSAFIVQVKDGTTSRFTSL